MIFIKILSRLSTVVVKFSGLISTIVTVLIIAIITALYYADKFFAGGYYSGFIMQNSVVASDGLFFRFSAFSEAHPVWSLVIIAAFFAFIFCIKRRLKRNQMLGGMVRLSANVLLNIIMIGAVITVAMNAMIISYVQTFSNDGEKAGASFFERSRFVSEQIENDRNLAAVALGKIIYDIENTPGYISTLTFDEHLELCGEVNRLMDLRGGPQTPEEHFLRNKLNYAPQTLDAMLEEIKNPAKISWVLLPPEQSAYHMTGADGEFNLKFVSSDGFFEAVYNKAGELLTEANDAVNMGTYNFADPVTQAQKHSTYDVLPYYEWGNIPDVRLPGEEFTLDDFLNRADYTEITVDENAYAEDDIELVLDALDRFNENTEARERYEEYKKLCGG